MIYWPIPLVVFLAIWYIVKHFSEDPKALLFVPASSFIATVFVMTLGWIFGALATCPDPRQSLERFAEALYLTTAFAGIPIQVFAGHMLVNRSVPSKLRPKSELGTFSLSCGIVGVYTGFLLVLGALLSIFVLAPMAVVSGLICLWKRRDGYAMTGLTLGVFLILFWVVLGRSLYAGWT